MHVKTWSTALHNVTLNHILYTGNARQSTALFPNRKTTFFLKQKLPKIWTLTFSLRLGDQWYLLKASLVEKHRNQTRCHLRWERRIAGTHKKCGKIQIIPVVMKTEEVEEEDQESVSSYQVLPSGIKTGAWLPVFHHQHAGSERVLHINSSVCLWVCVCTSVCVFREGT